MSVGRLHNSTHCLPAESHGFSCCGNAGGGRGERTVLKLVLSLSFLTHIPARLEPSLRQVLPSGPPISQLTTCSCANSSARLRSDPLRQAGPARGDLLGKMAPFLSRRFGDSRAPPLGPMEGGPASALVQACKQVEAFLSSHAS